MYPPKLDMNLKKLPRGDTYNKWLRWLVRGTDARNRHRKIRKKHISTVQVPLLRLYRCKKGGSMKNWVAMELFSHTIHDKPLRQLVLWGWKLYPAFLITLNRIPIRVRNPNPQCPLANCILYCIIQRDVTTLMQAMNSLGLEIVFRKSLLISVLNHLLHGWFT